MPEYLNPHPHDLYLTGPDGGTVHIRKGRRVRLSSFFDRYIDMVSGSAKGYLIKVSADQSVPLPATNRRVKIVRSRQSNRTSALVRPKQVIIKHVSAHTKKIVGRQTARGAAATSCCIEVLAKRTYPISNGIGVGILTRNRPASLRRLIDSILRFTDLGRTTLFVSDDGSTSAEQLDYLSQLELRGDVVVLKDQQQLGIAGNSNRLLRCLSRFPCNILLNDDVEILQKGWDNFYFDAMAKTKYHHFCHRQPGVYGANKGISNSVNGAILNVVTEKPHGAVMALDATAFAKVGFFDERFGQYGAEHVDWSNRLANSQLQPPGYFDVDGSHAYFLVHAEASAVEDRITKFKQAKAILDALGSRSGYVDASEATVVSRMSCVIPFREINRKDSIMTVLNNIRAQCYPDIEIVMTEEDTSPKIGEMACLPAKYVFTSGLPGPAFNKSRAWNVGVAACTCDFLVLHDADTLAPGNYFRLVADALAGAESCHLCDRIFNLDAEATRLVNSSGVANKPSCESVVGYFEGGTIACRRKTYWKVGGFVEEFVGYGCEDCDFYYRLSRASDWKEDRQLDLLHLYHNRVNGWGTYHQKNKDLEKKLAELLVGDRIARQHRVLLQSKWAHCLGEL